MKIGTVDYQAAEGGLTKRLRDQLSLLMATPEGTVVLDRDFGVDLSVLDMPMAEVQPLLAAELSDKIERYIPGLRLREVVPMSAELDGTLNLKVVVELDDG